ncbi:unnamed protein product [Orchesella dallaii]|uniref:O-acyltransferase WSD1 C-terminal domain-containing protein n=1 Tax=Orchesella dallaii TaxID=48710 RepID=A0ABP1Q6D2_9HEXA
MKQRIPTRPAGPHTHPRQFIISWAVALLISPVVIPILFSLYIYRGIIRLLGKNSGLVGYLTPYDCIFAVDSYYTRPYASNLTILELKHRIDVQTIRRLFKSRILDNPSFSKLSCIPVEYAGYWFWKRIQVDLNASVTLFHDSELEHGEADLDECLRRIVEMRYHNELFNVCLLNFGTRSYIVFRIHHTVCDGYSFNKLIDVFVGLQSKYLVKSTNQQFNLLQFITSLLSETIKWGKLIGNLPLHLCTLYKESLTHTPNFYTLRKTSTTGQIRRTVLPLSEIKTVRQITKSHFAAVGMSLMTGALQKLYDEVIPATSALRPERLAIMHSLPKPNHPLTTLCNHWGVGLFKVPFTRDPVDRLIGAEHDFNEYLTLQFDRLLHLHIPIVGLAPCFIVKWFFSINFGTSCGFTSVPGLFDKIAYVGDNTPGIDFGDGGFAEPNQVEVTHMWKVFGLQWRQTAVAVAMYTYRGEASVSMYANKDIVSDSKSMDRLMELFHEEFTELVTHCNKRDEKISTTKLESRDVSPRSLQDHGLINGSSKFLNPCFRNNKLA